jgi:hypothetical protein
VIAPEKSGDDKIDQDDLFYCGVNNSINFYWNFFPALRKVMKVVLEPAVSSIFEHRV